MYQDSISFQCPSPFQHHRSSLFARSHHLVRITRLHIARHISVAVPNHTQPVQRQVIEHNHRRGAEAKDGKGPHGIVQPRVPRVEAPLDRRDPVVQPLHPDSRVQDAQARHEHGLVDGELVHLAGEQSERPIRLGKAVRVGQADRRVLDDKVGGELDAPDDAQQARVGEPGEEAPDGLEQGAAEDAEPFAEVDVHGRAEE